MDIILPIPDELAQRLNVGGDLARRVLEALVAEEYRAGRLSKPELRRLLGLETRCEADGFLKAHGIYMDYDMADLERERADMARLGL